MKNYIDEITQKKIYFNDDDVFIIKWRPTPTNRKFVKKVYSGANVADAVKEFYGMVIKKNAYKYLYHVPQDRLGQEGDLILRMKGELTEFALGDLRLKSTIPNVKYEFKAIGSLTKCPKTLSDLLACEDYTSYPASISRWTNSKLFYCLLSHYLNLPHDQKAKLILEGERLFFRHKEKSGFNIEEENRIKVEVVTKNDLL